MPDDTPMIEPEALAIMKRTCDKWGLHEEVREAYDTYRKSGDAPAQALGSALYDWDL